MRKKCNKAALIQALVIIVIFTISGCAAVRPVNITWKTIPKIRIHEGRNWDVLTDMISHHFSTLEVNDRSSGYLKSSWKITDTCWAGIVFGGMVPCERKRVIIKYQETPYKAIIAVEQQKSDPWSNYRTWIVAGNDEKMEKEIIDQMVLMFASKDEIIPANNQEKNLSLGINKSSTIIPSRLGYKKTEPATSDKGVRWAVVIGISKYRDSQIPSLRYAANDANAFYKWLISPSGGRYSPSRVRILIDKDATGRNIKDALFEWLGQALEEDMVTIYFAGHGTPQSPDKLENLFLLPYDAQYGKIAATGFPMWDIETALNRFIKAKKVVVIADACHSGGVGQDFDVARRANRAIDVNPISSGLSNLSQIGDGVIVISASDDKQFSQESQKWGGGHGVFTYFLIEGLKGKADYIKDGNITLGELIPYLSEQVRRATKNAQSPTVAGRYDPALSIGR